MKLKQFKLNILILLSIEIYGMKLKQFKLKILILLLIEIYGTKGQNCCFTYCVNKA